MRFTRIVLSAALVAAITPPALRAQAPAAARCEDGTPAKPGYTACWFHGGVADASKPIAAKAAASKPAPSRAAAPGNAATVGTPSPAASERCKDGTVSEPGVTACWFHGGLAAAPPNAAAARTPTTRPAAVKGRAKARPAEKKKKAAATPKAKSSKGAAPGKASTPAKGKAKADHAAKAPPGATARCKDGSYTDAKKPKKGCKKHGGVARVL